MPERYHVSFEHISLWSVGKLGIPTHDDFAKDAVRLRRWDDTAKVVDLSTSQLTDLIPHLEAAAWNSP